MTAPYEVGIHLSAVNGVSGVLAVIGKDILGLHGSVNKLQHSLKNLKLGVMGGLSAAAGVGLLGVVVKTVEAAKDLSHELVQIKKLGLSPEQYKQVQAGVVGTVGKTVGMTQVEGYKAYGSMYSIFGHEESLKMLEPLSKFAQALGNTSGKFEGAFDKVYEMVRAGDLMGKFVDPQTHKIDPARLGGFLDLGAKVQLATHGKVGPETWLGLAQQGGPAMAGMSDKGLASMGIVAQAMGGQRGGTAVTSLYSQFIGGITTQRTAEEMKKMGMISGYTTGRGGQVRIAPEQKNREYIDAMKTDMVDFTKKLVETMTGKGMNHDQMSEALFTLFGRQTTQRLMSDMIRNMPQIEAERTRMMGAMGTDESVKLANSEDQEQALHNMNAAWKDLTATIGNSQAAVDMMNKLTSSLRELTEMAHNNPGTVSTILAGVTGFGLLLTGGGAAAILAALGPAGWLTGGIIALGAALKYVSPTAFDALIAHLKGLGTEFVTGVMNVLDGLKNLDFMKVVTGIAQVWDAAIGGLPGMLAKAIMGCIADIAALFKNALAHILPGVAPGDAGDRGGLGDIMKNKFAPGNKQGFNVPPAKGAQVHVKTALIVDGKELARSVSTHMASLYEHPTSSSLHDGMRGFSTA